MKAEELEKLRHKHRMLEIETEMNSKIRHEKLKFDLSCQLQRIRNADITRQVHNKAAGRHGG